MHWTWPKGVQWSSGLLWLTKRCHTLERGPDRAVGPTFTQLIPAAGASNDDLSSLLFLVYHSWTTSRTASLGWQRSSFTLLLFLCISFCRRDEKGSKKRKTNRIFLVLYVDFVEYSATNSSSGLIFVKIRAESGQIFNKNPGEMLICKKKIFLFCFEKWKTEQNLENFFSSLSLNYFE